MDDYIKRSRALGELNPDEIERGDVVEIGENIVVMHHDDYYDMFLKSELYDDIKPCEDAISRAWVKENMLKYGFSALDMTVTEFVEDAPSVAPNRPKGLDELVEGFAKALTYEDVVTAEAEAKGYAQGFKDGMESRPSGEWIPCSERLPSGDTQVLVNVCVDDAPWNIILMQAQSVKEYYKRGHINAWMPLPEPWKGADDE